MCILFAYVSRNPSESGYQLILANNRDELYQRPTKPADWWPDSPHCVSGLDEEPGREGGTWMGVSSEGKVGILLNILQNSTPDKDKKGRGHLVTDFLKSPQSGSTYLEALQGDRDSYNGFNLILLEYDRKKKCWDSMYYSNWDMDSPAPVQEEVFGVSNSILPKEYQKVQHGKEKFSSIIRQSQSTTALTDNLLQMLKDETRYWPDELIEQQGTGYLSPKLMQERSAVYVCHPDFAYGTRTHTVVVVDEQGHGTYTESTMEQPIDPTHPQWTTNTLSFNLPS